MSESILSARGLHTGYGTGSKACPIAGPLDLDIHAGRLICLLGPNGSGKSTLLRTLSGLQAPLAGSIRIGRETGRPSPKKLARMISLVLTDPVRQNNLTVESLVALGRYPHSGWLGSLQDNDHQIIRQALHETGMSAYASRKMTTLSDGESQKAMLARALAQDTAVMMLDEPTAHLDLPSRIQLMQLLHRLARQMKKGILVSTHELDLALQVADEAWLLQKGGRLDKGIPERLVLDGIFQAAFDKEGVLFDRTSGSFHIDTGKAGVIRFEGAGLAALWTRKALRRMGFELRESNEEAGLSVRVADETKGTEWILETGEKTAHYATLEGLLQALEETMNIQL